MSTEASEKHQTESNRIRKTVQRLPFIMALVFGTLWGLLYLFLGQMHAMWPMFNKQFPLILPSLIGIHTETMSPIVGTLVAFTDGALLAFTLSASIMLLMRKRRKVGSTHSPQRLTILVAAGMLVLLEIFSRGCLN